MGGALSKLLGTAHRLNPDGEDEEALHKSAGGGTSQDGKGLTSAATDARRQNSRHALHVLVRRESSFRRTTWTSGCEMVFPVWVGRLPFTTRRWWAVHMCTAIFLAAEAWRQHYGNAAIHHETEEPPRLAFKLPSGGAWPLAVGHREPRWQPRAMPLSSCSIVLSILLITSVSCFFS